MFKLNLGIQSSSEYWTRLGGGNVFNLKLKLLKFVTLKIPLDEDKKGTNGYFKHLNLNFNFTVYITIHSVMCDIRCFVIHIQNRNYF